MSNNERWMELMERAGECQVPYHCREQLVSYIVYHIPVGGFLEALLSNDLRNAFIRADDYNSRSVREYVLFLFNHAPAACWGSEENYEQWVSLRK